MQAEFPESRERRYRRSSEPMVALWCLFDHVRTRYCLRSAVLIDDFGNEMVSAGSDWHEASEPQVSRHSFAVTLPGRSLAGLAVIDGDASVLRSAMEDLQQGLHRIFFGEELQDRDAELEAQAERWNRVSEAGRLAVG